VCRHSKKVGNPCYRVIDEYLHTLILYSVNAGCKKLPENLYIPFILQYDRACYVCLLL
jgi:hypothetical protein